MTMIPNLEMNDGIQIPQLGYGVFQVDPDETERLVGTALEAGYRSIDTAQAYRNEDGVGAAISSSGINRDELFITTKLWNPNQSPEKALPSFEQSLQKLQVDYIDLFLIHWPQPMYDEYVDAWKVLEKLRADGRARSIGVSNFNTEHLQRLFDETGTVPAINQVELHPGFSQNTLREFHSKHNILTEAWSPIGQGQGLLKDPAIAQIAESKGKSSAQVVIRWHIQLGNVVIPKSATPSRIVENLDVFDFELTNEEMAQIESGKLPSYWTGSKYDVRKMINGTSNPTKTEQHHLHERNHLIWVVRQAMINDGAHDNAKTLSHASAAVIALMNAGALHVQG